MLFLEGRQEQVARALRREMEVASETARFRTGGRAARQGAVHRADDGKPEDGRVLPAADEDVLGYARSGSEAAVQLFAIREGKTISRDVFVLENLGDGPDEEAHLGVREAVLRRRRVRAAASARPAGAPRRARTGGCS